MSLLRNQLSGPTDPTTDAAWREPQPRKGFFTDTSICIGCKACQVACKEWNHVPSDAGDLAGSSYDNSGHLGANTWRHVAFVEQPRDRIAAAREGGRTVSLGMPGVRTDSGPGTQAADGTRLTTEQATAQALESLAEGNVPDFRWLMSSDVCKHCTHAGCLDVCPTGALFRTEFGTVVVQADVCNGCGYCVASCPFGVIGRREDGTVTNGASDPAASDPAASDPNRGVAQKCTLCYDRLKAGQTPACAQACPTTSIKSGDLSEMRRLAHERLATLHAAGHTEARLYGANENDGVGGTGSIFLLLDEPEVYGLPPDPVVPTADLPDMFTKAGWAGTAMIAAVIAIFWGNRKR